MKNRSAAFLVFLAMAISAIFPVIARADVIPGPGDCEGKSEGASCVDESQKAGTCGTITYTRTFTPPVPGAQTQTSQRSYFGCRAGVAPTKAATATTSTGAAPENTDSLPPNNQTAPAKKASSSMCSVRNVGASSGEGAALLMMLFAAFVGRRRRLPHKQPVHRSK
ncbi:MAG: hypothetical protein ACRELY_28190 [Polyangiaceae bacterium]